RRAARVQASPVESSLEQAVRSPVEEPSSCGIISTRGVCVTDSDESVEGIEVRLLLEAVHARWGYDFRDYAASSMRRRVLAALAASGLPHLGELQHRVLHDRAAFADLLDRLTVRVSEMFRDPAFH